MVKTTAGTNYEEKKCKQLIIISLLYEFSGYTFNTIKPQ